MNNYLMKPEYVLRIKEPERPVEDFIIDKQTYLVVNQAKDNKSDFFIGERRINHFYIIGLGPVKSEPVKELTASEKYNKMQFGIRVKAMKEREEQEERVRIVELRKKYKKLSECRDIDEFKAQFIANHSLKINNN